MYIFSDTRGVVTAVGLFDVTGKHNISEKYNKKQKVIIQPYANIMCNNFPRLLDIYSSLCRIKH